MGIDLVLLRPPVDVRRRARDDCRSGHRRPARGAPAARPRARAALAGRARRASSSACSCRSCAATALAASARDLAPQVLAYEFMNEPDFVIEEWERDLSSHVRAAAAVRGARGARLAPERRGARTLVRADHARRRAPAQPLGVGRRQPGARRCCRCIRIPTRGIRSATSMCIGMPAASLGVRRGVILGEFPGNGPEQHPGRRVAAGDDARGVPGVRGQRGLPGRVAVELQRNRCVRAAAGGAAARLRTAASGAREPASR